MEPNSPKISLLMLLLSLLFINSISTFPDLSDLTATVVAEISSKSTSTDTTTPSDPPAESPSMPPSSTSNPDDPPEENPFLEEVCKSTDHPLLCDATIAPLLKGKSDIISVLNAAMNAGLEATKVGIHLVEKISSTPGTSSDVAKILSECKESYEDAMENFQQAIGALPICDIGTMNSMLSAVITDVSDCEDVFSGTESPLAGYANKIVNMTSNCLAIVSLIPDHLKYTQLSLG